MTSSPETFRGLLLTAAAFMHLPLAAQTPPPASTLPSVTVTDRQVEPYAPDTASTGTRIEAPVRETPLSIQTITERLIRDKAISSPRELAEVVAGVQPVIGYGNTPSQWFVIRGFSNGSLNFRDGYRSAESFTPRDLANVERIEFLKGPASVLYGPSQPAGAVNTVTKTPQRGSFGIVDARVDSNSGFRSTLDLNRDAGVIGFRLNAAFDTGGSWLDNEKPRTVFLAPSLRLRPNDRIEVLYSGEFQKTRIDGFSNGLPMADGVFSLAPEVNISQPWARLDNRNDTHRLEFKFQLSEAWAFRQGLYFSRTRRSYQGVSPAFNQYDGTPLAAYPVMYNAGPTDDQSNRVAQSEFAGTVRHGEVVHQVVTGAEAYRSRFEFAFYDQFGCDAANNCFSGYTSNFATPLPPPPGGFTGGTPETTGSTGRALYASDRIAIGPWRVLAGLRRDWVDTLSGTDLERSHATTGRLGVMYLLDPVTSIYYSVGQSFTPNLGARVDGSVLKPEKGLQHEIGLKRQLRPGLEATLALFEITKSNIRHRVAGTAGAFDVFGEQKSRGLEASVVGQFDRQTRLIANYTYLPKAETTKDIDPDNVGNALYGVARHMANLWLVRDLPAWLPGPLSVGVGVAHVGARTADNTGSGFKLPSYTRVDLGLFHTIDRIDLALHLRNLTDARIFDTVDGFFVQRQAPRTLMLSARYRF